MVTVPPAHLNPLAGRPLSLGAAPASFMSRFHLKVDYGGFIHQESCEEFADLKDAQAYAEIVASELSQNNPKKVIVYVVDEEGAVVNWVTACATRQASGSHH
jgi:hypothetical protein